LLLVISPRRRGGKGKKKPQQYAPVPPIEEKTAGTGEEKIDRR